MRLLSNALLSLGFSCGVLAGVAMVAGNMDAVGYFVFSGVLFTLAAMGVDWLAKRW